MENEKEVDTEHINGIASNRQYEQGSTLGIPLDPLYPIVACTLALKLFMRIYYVGSIPPLVGGKHKEKRFVEPKIEYFLRFKSPLRED